MRTPGPSRRRPLQGDERDVIVFSSTFGRNGEGAFRRHFGVLGQAGGERRLNVAANSCKKEGRPHDLDAGRGDIVEGEDRPQATLLPACLDEYVTEDNPVRVIDVFIVELDLKARCARRHRGHPQAC